MIIKKNLNMFFQPFNRWETSDPNLSIPNWIQIIFLNLKSNSFSFVKIKLFFKKIA